MHEQQWARALELLEQAYALVAAPTLALLQGQALVNLERLAEARKRFLVASQPLDDPEASAAFRSAAQQATTELERLEPRIPMLTIHVESPKEHQQALEVKLDGRNLSSEELGRPLFVNPGAHVIKAHLGSDASVQDHIELKEGERKRVDLQLEAKTQAVLPGASRPAVVLRREVNMTPVWIALGAGSASLAVGVISGVVMLDAKSDLDKACTSSCPQSSEDDLDRFRTARTVSAVGYIGGATGITIAATLYWFFPDLEAQNEVANVQPYWSGHTLGLRGTF